MTFQSSFSYTEDLAGDLLVFGTSIVLRFPGECPQT